MKHAKIIIQEVEIVETVDEENDLLPNSFTCDDSSTLQDWFFRFCNTENITASIVELKFLLLETEQCFVIKLKSLIGEHISEKPRTTTTTRSKSLHKGKVASHQDIDQPDFRYHAISKKHYTGLKGNEVLARIESQLEEFSRTEGFVQSPLAKAKKIKILFNDRLALEINSDSE